MAQCLGAFLILFLAWGAGFPALAADGKPPLSVSVNGTSGIIAFFAPLPDGGFSIVGWRQEQKGWYVNPENAGGSGTWMIRLDIHGRKLWEKSFTGKEHGPAKFAAPLPDGGFVTAGWVNAADARVADAWGMRVNGQGKVLWSKTFTTKEHDLAEFAAASIQRRPSPGLGKIDAQAYAPDGGFIVLGQNNARTGGSNIWTMRVNGQGEVVWSKPAGDKERNKERDGAPSIKALPDGGLAVVGQPDVATGDRAWAMRIDSQGNVSGDWLFGEANTVLYVELVTAPADGGVVVATRDGRLMRLGNPGGTKWNVELGWSYYTDLGLVVQQPDGSFVMTGTDGTHHSGLNTKGRASMAYISSQGNRVWEETYGRFASWEKASPDYDDPAANAEVEALTATPEGGLIAIGSTNLREGGETDAWIFRINRSGAVQWDKTFGNDAPKSQLKTIAAAPDNGFIASGKRYLTAGAGSRSAWLLRLNGEGEVLWQAAIRDKGNDEAEHVVKSITAMPDGGLVIAGSSQPSTSSVGSMKITVWVVRLDASGTVLWQWPQ